MPLRLSTAAGSLAISAALATAAAGVLSFSLHKQRQSNLNTTHQRQILLLLKTSTAGTRHTATESTLISAILPGNYFVTCLSFATVNLADFYLDHCKQFILLLLLLFNIMV